MCSKFARPAAAFLALALTACGSDAGTGSLSSSAGSAAAPVGVEISGNVTAQAETRNALLVFVFTDLPPNQFPANAEPACISAVGPEGDFVLTVMPSERLTLVILRDEENDGVIDVGDPIAVLEDPDSTLLGLGDGARVDVRAVAVDFPRRRAVAESIEANPGTGANPEQTSPPETTETG